MTAESGTTATARTTALRAGTTVTQSVTRKTVVRTCDWEERDRRTWDVRPAGWDDGERDPFMFFISPWRPNHAGGVMDVLRPNVVDVLTVKER